MNLNSPAERCGNRFSMPNEIYQLGLSPGAIAAYGYLLSRECRRRGKEQYTCYPSYETIGNAIGRSSRSVSKYVEELAEAGLIFAESTSVITKDGMKRNGNLKYTLLPIQQAVDLFHSRQLAKLEGGLQKKHKRMDATEKKHKRKQKPRTEHTEARAVHEPEELPL